MWLGWRASCESSSVFRLKCVLWGASGHAQVLAGLVEQLGGEVCASFDLRADLPAVRGEKAYRGPNAFATWLAETPRPEEFTGVICIGGTYGNERIQVVNTFHSTGVRLTPLVHPAAFVECSATLGPGSHVLAGAVVAARACIGRACIINHNATVDHESTLSDGVHIAPGATLCGLVEVGTGAFIGAGATVLPRLSIGDDAVVGAGAVVIKSVPSGAVVAGNPAKTLRREQ